MKSNYEERKQARQDRFEELAQKNAKKQQDMVEHSRDILKDVPLGQPILVGHHSEKAHRNLLKRSHNAMDKSVEAGEKAAYYIDKAKSAAKNTSISSDDPEAITKLQEKLSVAEKNQATMKAANKIIKSKKKTSKQKKEELTELIRGSLMIFSHEKIHELLYGDRWGRIGFVVYQLTNNNANIRRMKQRLEHLEESEEDQTTTITINGIKVVDNVEENRLQMFFDEKPSEEIRTQLKQHGFKWARNEGCWQRFWSPDAKYWSEKIAESS